MPTFYNRWKKTRLTFTTTTATSTCEQQGQNLKNNKNPMTVFTYALKAPESRRQ
jgi:hypothetical protein